MRESAHDPVSLPHSPPLWNTALFVQGLPLEKTCWERVLTGAKEVM